MRDVPVGDSLLRRQCLWPPVAPLTWFRPAPTRWWIGVAGRWCARCGDHATFFWPPGPVVRSDSRLAAWIGRLADSGYHPCGSVPMGADDDATAATNGRGRVRGIDGLWVA